MSLKPSNLKPSNLVPASLNPFSKPSTMTCLWFDGHIEEAAEFYTTLIPHSKIESQVDYPSGHDFPGHLSGALTINLTIAGSRYQLLNGGPQFPQSEAASIVLMVDGQEEVDKYWAALTADGGRESQCGWCKDKFGVSWQVVPVQLEAAMSGPNPGAAAQALQQMTKIDIAVLEAASHS